MVWVKTVAILASIPASSRWHGSGVAAPSETVVDMTDPADSRAPDHVLDIVIPVYNEERGLADCIRRLRQYVCTSVPYSTRITVADNASTDDTLAVAHRLADELADVEVIHIDVKGRGAALQTAWAKSSADVVAYMDVTTETS